MEQSPGAALERVIALADRELDTRALRLGSEVDAVRWASLFLRRRRVELDARLGSAE